MREKEDFSYYEYEVGRYKNNYKPETKKLVWNVIDFDFNANKIIVKNLFEMNWTFLKGLLYAKKHHSDNFKDFAECVRSELQYELWSRAEYEFIACGWPADTSVTQKDLDKIQYDLNKEKERLIKKGYTWDAKIDIGYPSPSYKIDVYTQVMMNWDRFIDYLWNNKKLITKKKLGLD